MGIFRSNSTARFVAPIEPSAERLTRKHLAAIDRELGLIGDIPPPVRTPQMWARLDELLDERLVVRALPLPLRPSVPVVPWRPS